MQTKNKKKNKTVRTSLLNIFYLVWLDLIYGSSTERGCSTKSKNGSWSEESLQDHSRGSFHFCAYMHNCTRALLSLKLMTLLHSLLLLLEIFPGLDRCPWYAVGTLAASRCLYTSVPVCGESRQTTWKTCMRQTDLSNSIYPHHALFSLKLSALYNCTHILEFKCFCSCPPCPACLTLTLSPSSVSCSRLSILACCWAALPNSCAQCRFSTICQGALCGEGKIHRSSPNLPRCSQVASSSSSWAWKYTWGTFRPGHSSRQR